MSRNQFKLKPKLAFAAARPNHLDLLSTSTYARDARVSIGELFDTDWRRGWQIAKRHGYRIVKVKVEPC